MPKIYHTLVVQPRNESEGNPSTHGHYSMPVAILKRYWLASRRHDLDVKIEEIRPLTLKEVEKQWPTPKPTDLCSRHGLPRRPSCKKCDLGEVASAMNLLPFNGATIIETYEAKAGGEWGVVAKFRGEYVAFWTNDLKATYWGQGHYFRPEGASQILEADAMLRASERARSLVGQ